eukprot:TRINITY_DN70382_c0_g1_i1.p1 TRINITY_DN70382_c0_g1~~TRINITY_DN70382_c0_g1_i1.p1  ORF type:complete len:195 (+),score=30.38 TRINITY_DN70382_c0_g1_i1:98-682(+)
MAAGQDTKFSFLNSMGGPGSRKLHDQPATSNLTIARTRSLPQMGIAAGFSVPLGNKLGLNAYANLRAPHQARLDVPIHPRSAKAAQTRAIKSEELWFAEERIRPETLQPAGKFVLRPSGKRMIAENTNTMSHTDSLIWNLDLDQNDGLLRQIDSPIYKGAAGLNAKAERTPVYGHLPPTTMRTFGEGPPTDWNC